MNFFLSFCLHVYFNVASVLFVPTSRNTDILSRFPTINFRAIAAICEKIYCFRRLRTRRIAPTVFLSCSLPFSFLHSHAVVLRILLIKYPMSLNLYGWGAQYWCDTAATATATVVVVGEARELYLGHVDQGKRNTWVS